MIPSLLALCTFIVLSIPAAIIFIPLAMMTGDIMPLYRVGCRIARAGLWMAGVRVEVVGRERIPPNTACIFMSNHVSNLDPPALIPIIPGRISSFLKRSLMRIPALGYAMKLADFIPVDRGGSAANAKRSVQEAALLLAKGIHITMFVEGTRSPDGRMLPFKKGPFYLAKQTGAPCIPVSISGTETMMPKSSLRIRPGTVRITFHAPLHPGDFATRAELSAAVRASIASGLPEWMRN
jgi:1-acyl-sn-glycerol-3-phosphate acyltransferase